MFECVFFLSVGECVWVDLRIVFSLIKQNKLQIPFVLCSRTKAGEHATTPLKNFASFPVLNHPELLEMSTIFMHAREPNGQAFFRLPVPCFLFVKITQMALVNENAQSCEFNWKSKHVWMHAVTFVNEFKYIRARFVWCLFGQDSWKYKWV